MYVVRQGCLVKTTACRNLFTDCVAGRCEGGTASTICEQSSIWMATALHPTRHRLAADVLAAPIEQPAWVCRAGRLILSDRHYSHRTDYILPHQAAVLA